LAGHPSLRKLPVRINVDTDKCAGLGLCEAQAPDYFEVGEDGFSRPLRDAVAEADLENVRRAVDSCPVLALRLEAS
jgi:ferredoxin